MGKILAIIACFICFSLQGVEAQCREDRTDGSGWDYDRENPSGFSIGRMLENFVTPQLIRETGAIRKYIRDARFSEMMKLCGDLDAVDAIYKKGLRTAEYDIGRALFLSMMATLEHRNVELKVPLLGKIGLPLTFEADSLFRIRIRNLPTQIYFDTPKGIDGDRDKLQHFFGSAYLAYASESPGLARSTGHLIEWAEAKFVVGGADDPRDKRANKQGELFGQQLLYTKNLLPSEFLRIPVKDE